MIALAIDSSPSPLPFTRREDQGEGLQDKTQGDAVEVTTANPAQ
jgi:hypothetical protein